MIIQTDNPLFNSNQHKSNVSTGMKIITERHALRSLYLTRILMNEIDTNLEHFLFSNEFKTASQKLKTSLLEYHRFVQPSVHKNTAPWLTANLNRDSMGDLAFLIEAFSQMDFPAAASMFESLVEICSETVRAKKMHKDINVKKYSAIFRLLKAELQTDLNGGQATFNLSKEGRLTIRQGVAEIIFPKPQTNEIHIKQ